MILEELHLRNIRSYIDQTIKFSPGSTMLSGDIGSGKSSILLAIEFALFGSSRTDLPAENLLRKGATNGSVTLKFKIVNTPLTIHRTIKKEKQSIKQTAGYIQYPSGIKDLMPIEMKTEIINLLGYPADIVSKKNYIFRYTVYTPQESMKSILEEKSEVRLDVLRKIFNIDKYKVIRENLNIVLRQIRTDCAVMESKIEPLETKKIEQKKLSEEISELQLIIAKIEPGLLKTQQEIKRAELEIKLIEEKQRQYLHFSKLYQENKMLIKSKSDEQTRLQDDKEKLNQEINQISLNFSTDDLEKELQVLEQQSKQTIQRKSIINQKITQEQKIINELRNLIKLSEQELEQLEPKQRQEKELSLLVMKKIEIEKKEIELNRQFEDVSNKIAQMQTLKKQAEVLQEKISSIENCPTCLQQVATSHKTNISNLEQAKIDEFNIKLTTFNQNKSTLLIQKEDITKKLKQSYENDKLLTQIVLELKHLQEKKDNMQLRKQELISSIQENNSLMLELQNIIEVPEELIKEKREQMQKVQKKYILEKQLSQIILRTKNLEIEIKSVKSKIELLEEKKLVDQTETLNQLRQRLGNLTEQERSVSVDYTEHKTKLTNSQFNLQMVEKVINEILLEKNKLIKSKELQHWLENYFIPVSMTIEKHMMVNIHYLFSKLFQEWFSILIDDDNLLAKIDDSFQPVIEQNGYEMSFTSLSGGEKTSASLAYRLALNKVINDIIEQIKTKDLLILDEPTDGFSSEQLDKVREVLDCLRLKQIIIVSHENKIESMVDHVVRIEKEGHISRIA